MFFSWIFDLLLIKAAVTDMRYFAGNKVPRDLIHKENFGVIREAVFKLEYLFSQGI